LLLGVVAPRLKHGLKSQLLHNISINYIILLKFHLNCGKLLEKTEVRMKNKLFGTRINCYVGSLLRKQRIRSGKTGEEAAKHINISPDKMLSYEYGFEGVPLKFIAKLLELYGANIEEAVWKLNIAPHEFRNETQLNSFVNIVIYRLQFLFELFPQKMVLKFRLVH